MAGRLVRRAGSLAARPAAPAGPAGPPAGTPANAAAAAPVDATPAHDAAPPADSGATDGASMQGEGAADEGIRVPLLPRPQRLFLGRVGRAMMEGIQVIGKAQ